MLLSSSVDAGIGSRLPLVVTSLCNPFAPAMEDAFAAYFNTERIGGVHFPEPAKTIYNNLLDRLQTAFTSTADSDVWSVAATLAKALVAFSSEVRNQGEDWKDTAPPVLRQVYPPVSDNYFDSVSSTART